MHICDFEPYDIEPKVKDHTPLYTCTAILLPALKKMVTYSDMVCTGVIDPLISDVGSCGKQPPCPISQTGVHVYIHG